MVFRSYYNRQRSIFSYMSGVINYEKTNKLREAEMKKVSADREKNERLKKRQEEMITLYSKRFLK